MFSTISSFFELFQIEIIQKKSYNYDEILKIIKFKSYQNENLLVDIFNNINSYTNDESILYDAETYYLIGLYYKYQDNDIELTEKYLLKSIELNNTLALKKLCYLYFEIKKYNLVIKYANLAINEGIYLYSLIASVYDILYIRNNIALNFLVQSGKMRESDKKIINLNKINHNLLKNAIDNAILAIEKNDINGFLILETIFNGDEFRWYKKLLLIKNKINNIKFLNFINYEINKIEKKNKDIIEFNKKKELFTKLNNYKKCLICKKDDILHLILDSGNEICIDCFHPNIKS